MARSGRVRQGDVWFGEVRYSMVRQGVFRFVDSGNPIHRCENLTMVGLGLAGCARARYGEVK